MKNLLQIIKLLVIFVLALALAAAFSYSGMKVFNYWKQGRQSEEMTQHLIDQGVTQRPEQPAPAQKEPEPPEYAPVSVDFQALHEESEDIVAWLYGPDTLLDYPVAQSGDNEYYLRRLLNGRWNVGGTIFQDYRCPADYSAWHTLIYGHHMNNGTMFGTLQNYKEQAYYDENPVIYLLTPEKDFKVELIAGFLSDADGEVYSLPDTRQEKDALVAYCLSRSDFQTRTQVHTEDRLLTLSTCSDDYNNARYVLVGVLKELARDTE